MRTGRTASALLIGAVMSVALPGAALAIDPYQDDSRWQGDRDSEWDPAKHYDEKENKDERVMSSDDRVYKGSDGRYYCKRNDGTTGLLVGGLAGGVLGNIIGGGTLGTLLGAGGGALLGRHVEQRRDGDVKCR